MDQLTQWICIDLAVFVVVVALTGFIIPQILLIAFRKNLLDEVDPRKIHKGSVPRLGGIAFFPAILFSLLLMIGIGLQHMPETIRPIIREDLNVFCFTMCAVIVLYLVGMADDLVGVKYRAKFVVQFLAAALVISGGIYINNLAGFIGIRGIPECVAIVLTAVLIVFITNAINLIDGIDGLASGLSSIACAFYGVTFFSAGQHAYGMLSFATLGALVPFFYYNVFGDAKKHNKIFMGDTGALTIGLILSVLCFRTCQIDTSNSILHNINMNMTVVAFAPLMVPCLDVIRVYLNRLKAHRNPFLPDKTHIHHKLLALGIGQSVAMPAIVVASLLLTLLNCWLSIYVNITVLFVLDLAVWIAVNILLTRLIKRRKAKQVNN